MSNTEAAFVRSISDLAFLRWALVIFEELSMRPRAFIHL